MIKSLKFVKKFSTPNSFLVTKAELNAKIAIDKFGIILGLFFFVYNQKNINDKRQNN